MMMNDESKKPPAKDQEKGPFKKNRHPKSPTSVTSLNSDTAVPMLSEEHYGTGRMEHARSGSAGGRTCSEPQSKKQAKSGEKIGVKLNANENFRNNTKILRQQTRQQLV
jgi:hypothetical protein